jgi:hypothetical protein
MPVVVVTSEYGEDHLWKENICMLFMVIEQFKEGKIGQVSKRFQQKGRMLAVNIVYLPSWVDPVASRCWQLMEAPDRKSLAPWIAEWDDLIDFEIVAVQTSADFWATMERRP